MTPGDLQVRSLRRSDADDFEALVAATRALYADEGVRAPAERTLRIALHRRLEAGARVWFFDRAHGAPPAAFLVFSPGPVLHIEQFRVVPQARREGHGRRCVERLLETHAPDDHPVRVAVLADNAAGLAFWRSLGFGTGRLRLDVRPRPAPDSPVRTP